MAQVIDRAGFLLQSHLNHAVHAPVDAGKQLLALNIERQLDDAETTLLDGAGAQGGVGHTRLAADFHTMAHAAGVLGVNRRGILRI